MACERKASVRVILYLVIEEVSTVDNPQRDEKKVCLEPVMLYQVRHSVVDTTDVHFFFQAEDGIRDDLVTGFQTCALPIFRALFEILVVKAGFEARHNRAAGMRVSTNLIALPVAQHGDVRQQQRAVLADPFELEPVFVYEVEGEAATEQGLIHAVGGLAHVVARMSDGGAWI